VTGWGVVRVDPGAGASRKKHSTCPILEDRVFENCCECGHARRGDTAILQVAGLMRAATTQLNLSARAYHRTRSVKLARTIADLAGPIMDLREARRFNLAFSQGIAPSIT
jgi:hypothetical protein